MKNQKQGGANFYHSRCQTTPNPKISFSISAIKNHQQQQHKTKTDPNTKP
jgi:hypothetical protein